MKKACNTWTNTSPAGPSFDCTSSSAKSKNVAKKTLLVVSTVLLDEDREYAQLLREQLEEILQEDEREGYVKVSVMRIPT